MKRPMIACTLLSLSLTACGEDPSPGVFDDSSETGTETETATTTDDGSGDTGSNATSDTESGTSGTTLTTTSVDTETETPAEVCPGPDGFEDNDEFAKAAQVVLKDGLSVFSLGVDSTDPDFISFDAPKSDPVRIEASYSPNPGDTSDLALYVFNISGVEVGRHKEVRNAVSENLTATWLATSTNRYVAHIESDTPICMPVAVKIDANACTDDYEDNDTLAQARPLTLNEDVPTTLSGQVNIFGGDNDFYSVTGIATDPMVVEATYEAVAGDMSDLTLSVLDAVGQVVVTDDKPRTAPSETMRARWIPDAKDSVYTIKVESNAPSCLDYSLQVTARACTDSFEDNDTLETAIVLPSGEQEASISAMDDDFYFLESPTSTGQCRVSYDVPQNSTEDLTIVLRSTTGEELARHELPRTGEHEDLYVSWNAGQVPATLRVKATTPSCTNYRVQCGPFNEP